jgi:4-hydroxy 2-oxovalerate aldolase
VLEELKRKSNKKLAIILNERDISADRADEVLSPILGMVSLVRLAIDPENFTSAIELGKKVKKMGFELGFNLMYMSKWHKYEGLFDKFSQLDGLVDYFYMVDSFGGVYPDDVKNIISNIKEKTNVKLGFHGHNNLELGLINSLVAAEYGVDMIDATITGMGRGAGNLKMELLLSVLQSKGKVDFDYNYLSKVTDEFSKLQKKYDWGTNLPYMVSGANSLPQKQVMEWVSKRYYSFNSILRALSNQSKGLEDNEQFPKIKFNDIAKSTSALIIGGGPSVFTHRKALSEYLKRNPGLTIIHSSSRNAMCFSEVPNEQLFCLVGNEGHRLEEVFGSADVPNSKCILPPFPRKMGTYIPDGMKSRCYELHNVNFTDKLKDTHTALAIQTAIELGAKRIYLIGYDGYAGSNIESKQQEFFLENEFLFRKAIDAGLQCISLTATKYDSLLHASLFSGL